MRREPIGRTTVIITCAECGWERLAMGEVMADRFERDHAKTHKEVT